MAEMVEMCEEMRRRSKASRQHERCRVNGHGYRWNIRHAVTTEGERRGGEDERRWTAIGWTDSKRGGTMKATMRVRKMRTTEKGGMAPEYVCRCTRRSLNGDEVSANHWINGQAQRGGQDDENMCVDVRDVCRIGKESGSGTT